MNNIIAIGLFFLITNSAFTKTPKWIHDVSKVCKTSTQICAVGSGVNKRKAEQHARVELAKIFENNISSSFKSKLFSSGSTSFEDVSEEINESTQMAMEGLEIRKTYEDKISFYALAVINKNKMARSIQKEIAKFDEKLKIYLKDNTASSKIKLEKTYSKRELLSKRYTFLTGIELQSPVTFEQIFNSKKETLSHIITHVFIDEVEPKSVEKMIIKLLSASGYKTTSGKVVNKHATHILSGEVAVDKQYMKVEGFNKFKITVEITAKDRAKVETGHLIYTTIETGRNFTQSYNKGLTTIKKYLDENLTMLNIE